MLDAMQMFMHAWTGYKRTAFGHDEVRPVSDITNDSWGGFGITLIDALDTMMLMGLRDEVEIARKHVATLNFDKVPILNPIQSNPIQSNHQPNRMP